MKEGVPGQKDKILLLCQHFYPEMISTGMHMTQLSLALTKLGWQITVYCAQPRLNLKLENPNAPAEMEYRGIRILRVRGIGSHAGNLVRRALFALTYLLGSTWMVLRHRKEFKGMVITTNPPVLGLVGWLAGRLFGKPYLFIVYDVFPDAAVRLGLFKQWSPLVWIWEKVTRLMLNGASAIVVIGSDMATAVKEKINKVNHHKMHFIPNWADEQSVYPVLRESNTFRKEQHVEDYFVVQYSGRIGRTHNLEPLIEAADMLKGRKILFQFIGDGIKERPLLEMVHKKGLTNVQFLPYQDLPRLAEVLSAADLAVVCLGSSFTGLSVPSKTYGVMASATPILGLLDPESEIGRTILRNDCGVVLSNPTGPEVARVIEDLSKDPERLRAMGQNGYMTFKKNYTLAIAGERYSHLMESIFS